tara:strand:- start:8541 stop:8954 length:414 start_codon:yes stop_codon:yes gene_type:complete
MNKQELKKILRPLIKECIREVIFEEGSLSTIISEVVRGTSDQKIVRETQQPSFTQQIKNPDRKRKQLKEQRKKMLDAIGKDSYNGVDLFEGTTPLTNHGSSGTPHGSRPLDGTDPHDPGVDISKFGLTGVWKKLAGK